jgi:hypothetical protein
MTLLTRAVRAIDDAAVLLADAGPDTVRQALFEARSGLAAPMRVAAIGRIKAGKSTLVNGLLDGPVAPTGPDELTYNVTWFVHAATPGIVVHFTDGEPPARKPMSWLDRSVVRTSDDVGLLHRIAHVEVGLPRDILTRLQLIDTPGFGSFFDTDSRNTLEFLGISVERVDGDTREHAVGADAVLHLFTRGVAKSDHLLAEDFQGAAIGDFTPVNAIAALTKADSYWAADDPDRDPMAVAGHIVERLRGEPGMNRVFYDIVPVCGLLAAGAAGLVADDFVALEELAKAAPEVLLRKLRYASLFAKGSDDDLTVPAVKRAELVDRLGQYGIWLACDLIRSGGATGRELTDQLIERSGLAGLRDLLLSHFGNRATVIKTAGAVNRCRALSARMSQEIAGAPGVAAAAAAGRLEAFELDEPAIAELALLRALYHDTDQLGLSDEEVRELVMVTGERGGSCAARLQAQPRTTPNEMLATAQERLGYWRRRAGQFGLDSGTVYAARSAQRCYERISHHLRAAQQHLEMTL